MTQAALESGFADSAHFSRVFQAHFGMAPSRAVSSVRFVGVAHLESAALGSGAAERRRR